MKRLALPVLLWMIPVFGLWAQDRPNVVLIIIDDLNDWVGALKGHPQARTPNIDRLASQGMLFTNAHCQAPICGPSRASLLTGLYPFRTGNYAQLNDEDIRKPNEVAAKAEFLPDLFERHGYVTMGVGKIFHNGDKAKAFDRYGGNFDKYGPSPEKRFQYDPKWFPEKRGGTQTDWGAYPAHDSLMTDHKSADWAVAQLSKNYDKPFMLTVGFYRPHVPWYVPQPWLDIFEEDSIRTPAYDPKDMEDVPAMGRQVSDVPMMPTTEWMIRTGKWKAAVRAYLASMAFVDAQVGRVLDALDRSGHAKNTIVVLLSDHGYHLGEKNRFAKQALWERDTRVPLIIRRPGGVAGASSGASVQLLDIYPTLADLCGLKLSAAIDGHSLQPLLKDLGAKWKHPALVSYGPGNMAVRDDRYRLIRYEDGSEEWYDILKDPNEWRNLAGNKSVAKRFETLRAHIPKEWAASSKYVKYPVNDYFEARYGKGGE